MEFVDPTVDSAAKPRGAHLTENLEWRHDPTAIEVYSVVVPWNAGGEMNADERRSLRVVVGHVPGRLGSCMNVDLGPGLVERDRHADGRHCARRNRTAQIREAESETKARQ